MIQTVFENDYLTRLDNIIQWQERDVHQRESVSQHSYKVTVFSRFLLDYLLGTKKNESKELLDFRLDVLNHAMLHDWDEALIRRDLSHVMKYNKFNGEKIREEVDVLVGHLAEEELHGEGCNEAIKDICEPEESVHLVVKVADWLALLYFIKREKKMGNTNLDYEEKYCKESLLSVLGLLDSALKEKFADFSAREKIRDMWKKIYNGEL